MEHIHAVPEEYQVQNNGIADQSPTKVDGTVGHKITSALFGGDKAIGGQFNLVTIGGQETPKNGRLQEMQSRIAGFSSDYGVSTLAPTQLGEVRRTAPDIAKAIAQTKYVNGIHATEWEDIAKYSIHAAMDRTMIDNTAITVGYGGSDDTELNTRVLSYILPALDVRNRIEQATGTSPQIEIMMAYNAGIHVNGKKSEQVIQNTNRTVSLIQGFVERFAPEAQEHIKVVEDGHADNYGPYANYTIDYLCHLVNDIAHKNPEEHVEHEKAMMQALTTLEKLSRNHGQTEDGEDIRRRAIRYAVMHPLIFGDRLGIPKMPSIRPVDAAQARISIGGRPERLFNEFRSSLSRIATPEQFVSYVKGELPGSTVSDFNSHHIRTLESWLQAMQMRKEQGAKPNHAENPRYSMPLITNIGELPVYFQTESDIPLNIQGLELLAQGHNVQPREPQSVVEKNRMIAVNKDVQSLVDAVGRENLVDFYSNYV